MARSKSGRSGSASSRGGRTPQGGKDTSSGGRQNTSGRGAGAMEEKMQKGKASKKGRTSQSSAGIRGANDLRRGSSDDI